MTDRIQEVEVNPDGWSDWQTDNPKGFFQYCCDCKLVHEWQWRVSEDGRLNVEWRIRRDNRKTAAARRKRKPKGKK